MKRLVIACSLVAVAAAVVVQCTNTKNKTNNTTTVEGSTKMTRMKADKGLEYEILQEGSREAAKVGDVVAVHYTGWLNKDGQPAGQPFDSSHNRRQTFSLQIGAGMVIQGWEIGLVGMKVGEKRRLYIPSALGYGPRGAGAIIPANADLIFDVELIKIG